MLKLRPNLLKYKMF